MTCTWGVAVALFAWLLIQAHASRPLRERRPPKANRAPSFPTTRVDVNSTIDAELIHAYHEPGSLLGLPHSHTARPALNITGTYSGG